MRTNYCLSPRPTATGGAWAQNSEFGAVVIGGTVANDTTKVYPAPGFTQSVKVTWPAAPGGVSNCITAFNTVVGKTYTVTVWVLCPTGNPDPYCEVAFLPNGAPTSVKDQWVPITNTFTATTTTHYAGPRVSSPTAGQVLYIGACLIEEGFKSLTYFDGGTINCQWLGTPQQSASVNLSLNSTVVRTNLVPNPTWRKTSGVNVIRTNLCTNPSFETNTTGWLVTSTYWTNPATISTDATWSAVGAQSLKCVTDGTLTLQGCNYQFTGVANTTYTVTATIKADSGRPVAMHLRDTTNAVDVSTAAVAVGNTLRVTLTLTTGATASPNVLLAFGTDSTLGASTFHVDAVLIEQAATALPYFDGATAATSDGLAYNWSGTANGSTSQAKGAAFPAGSAPFASGIAGSPDWQSDPAGVTRVLSKVGQGNGTIWTLGPSASTGILSNPGEYANARVKVRQIGGTGPVSLIFRLGCYNSLNGFLGVFCSDSGTISIPANSAWIDVPVPPTLVTPAATYYVRWLVYQAAAGANTPGVIFEFKEGTLEKTSALGVAPGPYFDGTSPNSQWFGTVDASPSQQIVTSVNPNWPVIDVRVWNQENPPPVPFSSGPTTAPLILSDRLKGLSLSVGRQYELDQDEALSGSYDADNSDAALVGGTNGNLPMRLTSVTTWWAGKAYNTFKGYIRSWPDTDIDPATGESTLEVVDLFEPLANRPLRSIIEETHLNLSVLPSGYYPLTDGAGSVAAGNIATGSPYPAAPVVNSKGGAYPGVAFGKQTFLTNDSDSCFTMQGAWTTTTPPNDPGHGTQIQVSGPKNPTGPRVDLTQPWAMSCWDRVDVPTATGLTGSHDPMALAVVNKNIDNGVGVIGVQWSTSGTPSYGVNGYAGANGYSQSVTLAQIQAPMHLVVGYDGTNGFFWFNGVKHTFVYSLTGFDNYADYVTLGNFFQSQGVGYPYPSGNGSNHDLSHCAIWVGVCPTDADIQAIYSAGSAFTGESVETRITRVSRWAGQPGLVGDASLTTLGAMPDTKGSAALDVCKQAALDALGRLTVQNGVLRFISRNHDQSVSPNGGNGVWVLGSDTVHGELPYTGGPGFDFDPTHVYNDVTVARANGIVARAIDTVSQGRFFNRVLQTTLNLFADADATYASQWLIGRYAQPAPRVRTLTLEPSANPALWPMVLSLQLGDTVQVNHRTTGRPMRSTKCRVQKITHKVSDEEWSTDLELAPEPDYWLLAAMHTTLTASALAGATSITLAPLPDAAYNPSEASMGVGSTLMLDPGNGARETVTITSVASAPTPQATGYTSITVGVTACTFAHASGAVACDPLPAGVTDPTLWDARSVVGSTTLTSY